MDLKSDHFRTVRCKLCLVDFVEVFGLCKERKNEAKIVIDDIEYADLYDAYIFNVIITASPEIIDMIGDMVYLHEV